jgi:ABC-type antimicrobial peptide transport system permease subunit
MPWDSAKKFLKQKAIEFAAFIKDDPYIDEKRCLMIINQRFGTHFSDLHSIVAKGLMENTNRVDEGLKAWWDEATKNLYGALSFYPLLTAFLEFDKIIKGSGDANVRAMIIYFLVWVLIISGKVVSGMIGNPGEEKESGAIVNPKTWTEIANKAKVSA